MKNADWTTRSPRVEKRHDKSLSSCYLDFHREVMSLLLNGS
jgi:hypothetical protein